MVTASNALKVALLATLPAALSALGGPRTRCTPEMMKLAGMRSAPRGWGSVSRGYPVPPRDALRALATVEDQGTSPAADLNFFRARVPPPPRPPNARNSSPPPPKSRPLPSAPTLAGEAGSAPPADEKASSDGTEMNLPSTAEVEYIGEQKIVTGEVQFTKCARCLAVYAIDKQNLGRNGRRIECSVCGNKWFQSADKLYSLNDDFGLIPYPEERSNRIKQDLAAGRYVGGRRRGKEGFTIFVGNLNFETTEMDLEELFGSYGEMLSIKMVREVDGRSKGFAFVEMAQEECGKLAVDELDGTELDGRGIVVKESSKKGGGGGGGKGGDRNGNRRNNNAGGNGRGEE